MCLINEKQTFQNREAFQNREVCIPKHTGSVMSLQSLHFVSLTHRHVCHNTDVFHYTKKTCSASLHSKDVKGLYISDPQLVYQLKTVSDSQKKLPNKTCDAYQFLQYLIGAEGKISYPSFGELAVLSKC